MAGTFCSGSYVVFVIGKVVLITAFVGPACLRSTMSLTVLRTLGMCSGRPTFGFGSSTGIASLQS